MIVSRQHRFVFVSAPRCGTNMMYRALIEYFGGQRRALGIGLHPSILIPSLKAEFASYLTWAIVRDPYRRMVSNWSWSRGSEIAQQFDGGKDFVGFAEWIATASEAEYAAYGRMPFENLTDRYRPMAVQRFVRMEHLQEDLARLPFWRRVPLHRLNASPPLERSWDDYITPDAARAIEHWARPDFERFGYSLWSDR